MSIVKTASNTFASAVTTALTYPQATWTAATVKQTIYITNFKKELLAIIVMEIVRLRTWRLRSD